MLARILVLLRARLSAQHEGSAFPAAALLMQGFVSGVLCGLVRGELPPFAYALFALSVSAALVAVPLLGELSSLLSSDEADEWVRSLPASDLEVRAARLLHLLVALSTLTLGAIVPAALLARFDLAARPGLVLAGLAQSLFLAAMLLLVQAALRGRAQALLVAAQTAVFLAVMVGSAVGLRHVPAMTAWGSPGADLHSLLAAFPPAWFAAPFADGPLPAGWALAAPAATLASVLTLALIPPPPQAPAARGKPVLSRLLHPLRALATRAWVRSDERASFDLVFDGLPREREFVIRTYPLLAVPLGFLVLDPGMLPLLVFTPGAWLPILLSHVPASASHGARWLLDTAPTAAAAIANGALKAVAVRFVLPLYLLLLLFCASMAGIAFALMLVPSGFLVSLLVLRATWGRCVADKPMSTAPDNLRVEPNLLGLVMTLAFLLSAVSIAAMFLLTTALAAVVAAALLVGVEAVADRSWRTKGLSPARQ